jgi:hypothetical protein
MGIFHKNSMSQLKQFQYHNSSWRIAFESIAAVTSTRKWISSERLLENNINKLLLYRKYLINKYCMNIF